jgi:pimeloyl-ACP methyl ester carboxylesterase
MNAKVNERKIQTSYDRRGNPCWKSTMSPPDDSLAVCNMVPDRIIPVIFVPGVMGSNLIQKDAKAKDAIKWRMDGALSAGEWALPTRGAKFRRKYLTPTAMTLDTAGEIPKGTQQTDEELRRRGWGEVGNLSYGTWLVWLENALNDFDAAKGGERDQLIGQLMGTLTGDEPLIKDAVALSYRYRFPVHASGYNWLASNGDSAILLAKRIDDIIERYRKEKKKCEKVIIVTHSMGGLVTRYCSEVLAKNANIFGVVHGVMPAIGAAAVYRRMKSGTEDPTGFLNVAGAATAAALGNDAAEMTAVLSAAPGPLQLLPTPEYGNNWLKIRDGKTEYSLPKGSDPYSEIYTVRGQWWSMCEDQLVNPLNIERDPKKKQAVVNQDWAAFDKIISNKVKPFHEDIKGQYHPNTFAFIGSSDDKKAYGTVTWQGDGGSWMRGSRPADVLGAKQVEVDRTTDGYSGLHETRDVMAPLGGSGFTKNERQLYTISQPDEPGDGTVPHRSGIAPKDRVKSMAQFNAGHEPAFKEGPDLARIRRFTLRAIVQIAGEVTTTSLKYD